MLQNWSIIFSNIQSSVSPEMLSQQTCFFHKLRAHEFEKTETKFQEDQPSDSAGVTRGLDFKFYLL